MWNYSTTFLKNYLSNGLPVHSLYWKDCPGVYMIFCVNSGAANDPIGKEGVAHFLEHILCHSSNMSKGELDRFFRMKADDADFGKTNFHNTYFQFYVPLENIESSLGVFSEMIMSPSLNKDIVPQIKLERGLITDEFWTQHHGDIFADLEFRKRRALFPGHWFSRFVSVVGTPGSVQKINLKDLKKYHQDYYHPANMSIFCVGGIDVDGLLTILNASSFGNSRTGIKPPKREKLVDFDPPPESYYEFSISEKIEGAWKADCFHYESTAIIPGVVSDQVFDVLLEMIYLTLFQDIREGRGLKYSFGAYKSRIGEFYEIFIRFRSLPLDIRKDFSDIVSQSINSICDRKDLFEEVKKNKENKVKMRNPSPQEVCERAFLNHIFLDDVTSDEDDIERFKKVEFADICEVIKKYLREDMRWTVLMLP